MLLIASNVCSTGGKIASLKSKQKIKNKTKGLINGAASVRKQMKYKKRHIKKG